MAKANDGVVLCLGSAMACHHPRDEELPANAKLNSVGPSEQGFRSTLAELAGAGGIAIEHITKSHIRKEDVVAKVLAVRGDHPGLVHIISASPGNLRTTTGPRRSSPGCPPVLAPHPQGRERWVTV